MGLFVKVKGRECVKVCEDDGIVCGGGECWYVKGLGCLKCIF